MPLNCLTDEILDSMLSLRLFTSLVRWQYVKADYRPVRAAASPQSMVLEDSSGQPLSDKKWAYTAASDGTITVGWILFNHPTIRDEEVPVPEWEWELLWDREIPPHVRIDGLDITQDLELVWFDDHHGVIVDKVSPLPRTPGKPSEACVQAPGTEPDPVTQEENRLFDKSMAFLIQPVGFTPEKHFAELPNEFICQIDVEPRLTWDEERPIVCRDTLLTLTARTKPAITDTGRYKSLWHFPDHTKPDQQWKEVDGLACTHLPDDKYFGTWYRVEVSIFDKSRGDMRVAGDIIHLNLPSCP